MIPTVSRIIFGAQRQISARIILPSVMSYSNGGPPGHGMGELGSGAGKGGGAGGTVREAGGTFGKMEAAREEEYFKRLQKLQLKQLHDQLDDEVEYHENQMKHHKDAIDRHKKRMRELKTEEEEIK